MKTSFTALFVGLLLLGATTRVSAQSTPVHADSTLLSDRIEGDYHIKHYLVVSPDEADYVVHYPINQATLNRALEQNGVVLQQLDSFATKVLADTLNRVQTVTIVGYASPDGPLALNQALAKRRAADMKAYVDQHYHFSKHYALSWDAKVASWASLHDAVAASVIPHRDSVLTILHGNHTEAQKEAALKRMPESWHFLTAKILPPVRRAEVAVVYRRGAVVEERTLIPKPKPTPAPTPTPTPVAKPVSTQQPAPEVVIIEEIVEQVEDPCCNEFCNSEQLGLIIDMTGVEIDY